MTMGQKEKIRILLSMQEHPEQYTDEQIRQMLADDQELAELLDQLALTKQAFAKSEADEETVAVDEEWQKFLAEHAGEMEDNSHADKGRANNFSRFILHSSLQKFAACFIGILFVAGIAFAAVHFARKTSNGKQQPVRTEQTASAKSGIAQPKDIAETDTTAMAQPIVFDNVPLEKIVTQIAAHYKKEAVFQQTDARQLRLYFEWKPDEGLESTLHRLNLFESITIELTDDKIVVE